MEKVDFEKTGLHNQDTLLSKKENIQNKNNINRQEPQDLENVNNINNKNHQEPQNQANDQEQEALEINKQIVKLQSQSKNRHACEKLKFKKFLNC